MLEHQPISNSVVLSSKKAVVVIYTISGVCLFIRLGVTAGRCTRGDAEAHTEARTGASTLVDTCDHL